MFIKMVSALKLRRRRDQLVPAQPSLSPIEFARDRTDGFPMPGQPPS
jgi:hypothetical protein